MKQLDDAVATGKITIKRNFLSQAGCESGYQWAAKYLSGLQRGLCLHGNPSGAYRLCWILLSTISPIDQFTANVPSSALHDQCSGSVTDAYGQPLFVRLPIQVLRINLQLLLAAPALTPNKILPSGCTVCPDYLNQGYNQQPGRALKRRTFPIAPTNWMAIAAVLVGVIAIGGTAMRVNDTVWNSILESSRCHWRKKRFFNPERQCRDIYYSDDQRSLDSVGPPIFR